MSEDTKEPSAWVLRFCPLIPKAGGVLDLASGRGRHARHVLDRGHPVVAVDRDCSGLLDLVGRAGAEVVAHDLEDRSPWPFAEHRFAGIIVTNYLHRPLLPDLFSSLSAGGVLIYETFAEGNERLGRPRNLDFLLRPGELLDVVNGRLQVVAYEHGRIHRPRPAVVQRICAVNAAPGVGLSLDDPSADLPG